MCVILPTAFFFLYNVRVMGKGSCKGVFLLCFKVFVLRMIDQQSPYSPNGAVSSLNSLGKKTETSKQGLGKGVILEH